MPPKNGPLVNPPLGGVKSQQDNWVNVNWMPHASLSQTSHVCLVVRSVHVSFDDLEIYKQQEWSVKVSIRGIGGIELVPVNMNTPTSSVISEAELPSGFCFDVFRSTHACQWNHFFHLPFRWRDLPRDSYLHFQVIDHSGVVLYETSMSFFNDYGRLVTGLLRLEMNAESNPHENPHRFEDIPLSQEEDLVLKAFMVSDQLQRFQESSGTSILNSTTTAVNYARKTLGAIPSTPWLDVINNQHCMRVAHEGRNASKRSGFNAIENSPSNLIIELPMFDVPVMHEETFYPLSQKGAVSALSLSLHRKRIQNSAIGSPSHPLNLVKFLDYEDEIDNPFEDKYRTLAHDLLRGLVDPALKPDREQRDRLAAIIASPSHHPTREEKDLLWRFRFSLVDNRRALTKFLLAVDWTVESEVVQAAELLEQWRRRSPIEVTDALKLLGKHVAFQTNLVRTYAIDTLAVAPDEELRLYLLQLVQALKYETLQGSDRRSPNQLGPESSSTVSSLASFLIGRAAGNLQLASYLYWYLKVELQDPSHGARYREVFTALKKRLSDTPFRASIISESQTYTDRFDAASSQAEAKESRAGSFKSIVDSVSKLSSSLRGSEQSPCINDHPNKQNPKRKSLWDILVAQDHFISGLMDIQMRCRDTRGKKDAKETQLRAMLSKEGYDRNSCRDAVPLPSAPDFLVNGVNSQTAKMFKSALYPALVEFHVECDLSGNSKLVPSHDGSSLQSIDHLSHYKVIVKTGDDLRQDQLVIMMIQLMDGLLKRAALDLCLSPYSIIAMSPTSGLVEFVDGSMPISQILSNYNGSIMNFFQSCAPQQGTKYGCRQDVISTYVRSCAGYCVITFLLAVGDRHLDNILLDTNGHFFHIDFGFIFGRDPKPLPPAFRLTREMVEGMGGLDSAEYRQFCSLACQAYNALRKSAGLVLNLLHLMSDAGIEDLSNNPSADAEGVIAKVEERFRLELTDEQAEHYFLGLINDCLSAIAPRVMDVFHSLAVARR